MRHLTAGTRVLTREQAYVLCSAAADLEISEFVNPISLVACYLPLVVPKR